VRIFPNRPRRIRLGVLAAILLALLGYCRWRTAWWPDIELQTTHYVIRSSATMEHTEEARRALEALHAAYTAFFAGFPDRRGSDGLLKVNLYRDQQEFRRCNPRARWAEAYYGRGRCYAYRADSDANPYHWLIHEATHQLNHEVTCLDAPRWLDEGLASFFSTSRYVDGGLLLGQPNGDSYPIWWVYDLHLSGDVDADIRAGEVIPLRAIITGRGGPDIDKKFNLYYIHWWSLTHFLLQGGGPERREACFQLIRDGGGLEAFERRIGPVEGVQAEWYQYLRALQDRAVGGEFSPHAPAHA
jgi:hypothetical protein